MWQVSLQSTMHGACRTDVCGLHPAGTTLASPNSPVLMASQSDKHLKRVARPAVAAPAGIEFICIEGCRERLSEPLHPCPFDACIACACVRLIPILLAQDVFELCIPGQSLRWLHGLLEG